jgi:3-oxoacyl-[acyl-carrier-protein] synthase-3
MRAAIEAVATCAERGLGSRALAVRAAARALELAGREPHAVEMLVNAGVYRDEHIIEPAMAPFVQRGIGANGGFPPLRAAGTFSFDLSNGAAGPLTAMGVVAGFMRSGRVRSGLVVASDTDPEPARSEGYPFAPAGGAILLRADAGPQGGSDGEGFCWFQARTWSEHFALYEARLCGTDDATGNGAPGAAAQRLRVRQDPAFLERCVDCAARTVEDVFHRRGLDIGTIDLLLVAPPVAPVAEQLAERLGAAHLAPGPAPSAAVAPAGLHTAALAFAIEAAARDGRWARARRILLVAASAGVTVSLALYERDPATSKPLA